ncbi:hypothetical protein MPSEU_000766400 [Mayamaea pseudoterrestris]|nr:hypothetical protein MPSEU_000766400 [Mayamaea pseudoterrestris]
MMRFIKAASFLLLLKSPLAKADGSLRQRDQNERNVMTMSQAVADEFTTSSLSWEQLLQESSLPPPTASSSTKRPTRRPSRTPRPASEGSAAPTDLFPTNPTPRPTTPLETTTRPTGVETTPRPTNGASNAPVAIASNAPTDIFPATGAPVRPTRAPKTPRPTDTSTTTTAPASSVAPTDTALRPTRAPRPTNLPKTPRPSLAAAPTNAPVAAAPVTLPTNAPVVAPVAVTTAPVSVPTGTPVAVTFAPVAVPTNVPVATPVAFPSNMPIPSPVAAPTLAPIATPAPVIAPTAAPVATSAPATRPTAPLPTPRPTNLATTAPAGFPTILSSLPVAAPPTNAPVATAPSTPTDQSLLDLIKNDSSRSEFVTFIDAAGRQNVVDTSTPQTLFAPRNNAFNVLGNTYSTMLLENEDYFLHLRSLVDNHITLQGSYETFQNGQALTMLSQEQSVIESSNNASFVIATFASTFDYVDAVNLPSSGELATNGVLYKVQSLLLPVWYYLDLITLMQVQSDTYGTLLTLLDQAGLMEIVASTEGTTLIAPNNAAFAALAPEVTEYLTSNVDALKQVLTYHLLPEIVNPLAYPLGQSVRVKSVEGSNVVVLVQRSAENTAATTFNGVTSVGSIFLTKYSIRFESPEVLLPRGFEIPASPTASTLAPALSPAPTTTPVGSPVASPTFPPITRPSSIPRVEPTSRPTPSVSGRDIAEEIISNVDATSFLTVLTNAKILNRLAGNSAQTVFVPVVSAFADFDAAYLETLVTDRQYFLHLQSLASNHITVQDTLETLEDGTVLELNSGEQATVKVDDSGDAFIATIASDSGLAEEIPVRSPPILTSNGAIFLTDAILTPIWYYQNIIDVISQGSRFSTLLNLIELAGLTETIATSVGTTLLAPNNDAFAALPDETINYLTDAANVEDLKSILSYHFLPIILNPIEFPVNQDVDVATAQGDSVTLRIDSNNFAISLNGVSQIGFMFLSKYGGRIQLGEVLVPSGMTLPGL